MERQAGIGPGSVSGSLCDLSVPVSIFSSVKWK
jgi:hypothetical protein